MRNRDVFDARFRGKVRFVGVDLNGLIARDTAIVDQVVFRVDVPVFLGTLTERQRQMALDLASGESTGEVALLHGVTPSAVSQFRHRFKRLYDDYFAQ